MSDDRKKDKDKRVPPRTGPVRPTDSNLVAFLERLWTRDNPPESLKVHRVLGQARNVRDPNPIFRETFAADANYDVERCTLLANEIIAAAQDDTNSNERKCLYEILIADHYQGSHPLQRRLGPLVPDTTMLNGGSGGAGRTGGLGGGGGEDDEDTGIPGVRPLTHVYLDRLANTITRAMEQTHAVLGDALQLHQGIIVSQQGHAEKLQNEVRTLHASLQDAADRSLDREIVREREKAKIRVVNTGLRIGENVVAGYFGADVVDGGPTPKRIAPAAAPTGEGGDADSGAPRAAARFGRSRERALVENFLSECKEETVRTTDGREVNVVIELFGDWEKGEDLTVTDIFAGLRLIKPGIFTPAQFGIFVGVASGDLPPEALDQIMVGSGKPQEISVEQLMRAQPFATQSMLFALQQIKQLRDEAAEKATAQKAQQGGAK